MKKQSSIFSASFFCLMVVLSGCGRKEVKHVREYAGSSSCRECHEKFYELWSTSHHAKALQPWSAELAAMIPDQPEPIEAEGLFYMTHITPERGWMTDNEGREYEIPYTLGGKNYYNFLSLMDDGRLQVLPVFYDVQNASWRNTTLSMLRHFSDGTQDTPVSWRDPMLTFNAECFRCHVSQSESNYDPETDTYDTVWKEAGISCEACHGPSSEHIRVCKEAPEGTVPDDLELIRWDEDMTVKQQNDSCAGCHTKGGAITDSFDTSDDYWDHYDLTTFDHGDYYPDGFDLGENYTMGSWWLSPCATKGTLACTTCHTSSGRYKFSDNPNESCLSCHEKRRADAAEHMHHASGGATKCNDCHMAMHSFGGMNQSDHSMRPPMPNLSIETGSRNACIICHADESNEWALEHIREWHPDFDKHTEFEMKRALLVKALRDGDWEKLPAALDYIDDPASDPLFATSLIRLLPPSGDPRLHEVLRRQATGNAHPLVRSAAAAQLDADNTPADRPALLQAISDEKRLVRVRAAERLAALPEEQIPAKNRAALQAAMEEMWASYNLRLDNWGSHYNAANIFMRQQRYRDAAEKYDRAHALRADIPQPLINGSMAFAQMGDLAGAEERLLKANQLPEPSAEAQFNLGLLYAEQGRTDEAKTALYASLKIRPDNAQAAYNLAVLLAEKNYPETFRLLNLAIQADPYNPRYVETLAYYYVQTGQADLAKKIIEQGFERGVASPGIQGLYQQLR
jgi:tetratricopeptide (TPR) repeat protein